MADDRQTPPTVQYEVMPYRVPHAEAVPGEGSVVTLPTGWVPLSVTVQGEWLIVLCYREL